MVSPQQSLRHGRPSRRLLRKRLSGLAFAAQMLGYGNPSLARRHSRKTPPAATRPPDAHAPCSRKSRSHGRARARRASSASVTSQHVFTMRNNTPYARPPLRAPLSRRNARRPGQTIWAFGQTAPRRSRNLYASPSVPACPAPNRWAGCRPHHAGMPCRACPVAPALSLPRRPLSSGQLEAAAHAIRRCRIEWR